MHVLKYIKIFINGILYGISNLIPGVSCGTTLLITKMFDPMIHAINGVHREPRKNLPFLAALFSGTAVGVVGFANCITFLMSRFPFATSLFFSGLILGGTPMMFRKAHEKTVHKRYYIPCVICFLLVAGIASMKGFGSTRVETILTLPVFIWLFLASAASSAAMVLPGSSSAIVMLLFGAYHTSVNADANIIHFADFESFKNAAMILIPILLGMAAGMTLISKIMVFLFKKFYSVTYISMIGLMAGSLFTLMNNISIYTSGLTDKEIISAVFLFFVGVFTAYQLSRRNSATGNEPHKKEKAVKTNPVAVKEA